MYDRTRFPLMPELKDDLASLRIDRETPRPGRWRLPLILLVVLGVAVAGGWYFAKAHPVFGVVEVETVQRRWRAAACQCRRAHPDRVRLSVARKQSVVSSKIQGRSRNCAWKREAW